MDAPRTPPIAAPPLAPASAIDLSVLIVHYRSARDTAELLEVLGTQLAPGRHEVVIADNSPGLGQVAGLERPGVRVVQVGRNLGFAGGVELARSIALGRLLLVLNPDVRPHPGAIEALIAAHARAPRAAVLAPRMVHENGTAQDSLRTFYRWETILAARTPWGMMPRGRRLLAEHLGARLDPRAEQSVDWALGAALLIDPARVPLERGHLLDPRFFLYLEDVDLCLRAWRAGGEVRFVPQAAFTHRHARASRRRWWSSANRHHLMSLVRFVAKHRGLPARPSPEAARAPQAGREAAA